MENIIKKVKDFRIKSPEEALKGFGEWFDSNKKITITIALIVGLITHIVLLSVMIVSPDGLWNYITYSAGQVETESGRWMINIIDTLRKNLAIPTITTIISIVITAITSVFIVDLLKLKSKISCAITAIFLEVSPCLTMTLLYSYTADAYCYAFLFGTLAVWCIYREKHKVLGACFGSIFTMLTLALYQSYIGVIIGLCIIRPIVEVFNNKDYKKLFIDIGISILSVIVGLGLYWVTEQIALSIYETKLSSYGGASDVSLMNTLENLPQSILKIYGYFINFFIGGDIVNNPCMSRNIFYKILYLVVGIAGIFVLTFRKVDDKKKKIIDAILICAMTVVLPIGLNFVILIAPETICYPFNTAGLILMIPFMMVVLENFELNKGAIFKWISIVLLFIIAVTYFLAANATYTGVRMKYNQAYSIALRMVDRIENCEGYTPDKQWLICGIVDETNTQPVSDLYYLTLGGFANGPIFHGNYWGMTETWRKFMQVYLGIQPNFCSVEDYFKVCGTQYFKDMPIFPAQGSVAEIDGIMVVKMTNNVPMN